jgi:hypothetical protein
MLFPVYRKLSSLSRSITSPGIAVIWFGGWSSNFRVLSVHTALEATQGQKDGDLPSERHIEEVASVEGYFEVCSQFDARVA